MKPAYPAPGTRQYAPTYASGLGEEITYATATYVRTAIEDVKVGDETFVGHTVLQVGERMLEFNNHTVVRYREWDTILIRKKD